MRKNRTGTCCSMLPTSVVLKHSSALHCLTWRSDSGKMHVHGDLSRMAVIVSGWFRKPVQTALEPYLATHGLQT